VFHVLVKEFRAVTLLERPFE
jgi:hypothetical protein